MKYIYVVDCNVRDKLIKHGFQMLKYNMGNTYIFKNIPEKFASLENEFKGKVVLKDTLKIFF